MWTSTGSDTRLSLVIALRRGSGDRQRDVVQRDRDIAGQDVDEGGGIAHRGSGRDDVARIAGAARKVMAPVPEAGRTLIREHARGLIDPVMARLDERRRPAGAWIGGDVEDTVAAIARWGRMRRRGQRDRH